MNATARLPIFFLVFCVLSAARIAGAAPVSPALASENRLARSQAAACDAYRDLASRFNGTLAGRFPFGSVDSSEVPYSDVAAFFRNLSPHLALLRATLPDSLPDGTDRRAVDGFFDALDSVASFLGIIGGAPDGPLLDVGFQALPQATKGGEQIVIWSLQSDGDRAFWPNGKSRVAWAPGRLMSMGWEWAEQSAWRPRARKDANARIEGYDATGVSAGFTQAGDWALLRLIARHGARRDKWFAETADIPLSFNVPVVKGRVFGDAHRQQVLRVNLRLSWLDRKSHQDRFVDVPAFPFRAPTAGKP